MHQEHLEKLISTGYKLISLETDSPEQTLNDFRPLVREGKAIYAWEKERGLSRMEAGHITLPKTKTPEMVLKYIEQSNLFGIYLLVGFSKELAQPMLRPTIEQIATDKRHSKIIIFIDHNFTYPQKMLDKLLIVQEKEVRERTSFAGIS